MRPSFGRRRRARTRSSPARCRRRVPSARTAAASAREPPAAVSVRGVEARAVDLPLVDEVGVTEHVHRSVDQGEPRASRSPSAVSCPASSAATARSTYAASSFSIARPRRSRSAASSSSACITRSFTGSKSAVLHDGGRGAGASAGRHAQASSAATRRSGQRRTTSERRRSGSVVARHRRRRAPTPDVWDGLPIGFGRRRREPGPVDLAGVGEHTCATRSKKRTCAGGLPSIHSASATRARRPRSEYTERFPGSSIHTRTSDHDGGLGGVDGPGMSER